MMEIRIHGRGGQGAVTAAELIAAAAFYDGKFSQAFPNFGVERRGAPVLAYARINDKFIRLRSQVYQPDFLIVQDATLIDANFFTDLKKGTKILLNTEKSAVDFKLPVGIEIYPIKATEVALEIIGRPIINTTLLGAFAKLSGLISLSGVEQAIKERFENKDLAKKNVLAAKKGFEII